MTAEHGRRDGKDATPSFQFCLPTGEFCLPPGVIIEADSLIDFVSLSSGSVNSYLWLFVWQVLILTAAEPWLLI